MWYSQIWRSNEPSHETWQTQETILYQKGSLPKSHSPFGLLPSEGLAPSHPLQASVADPQPLLEAHHPDIFISPASAAPAPQV